MQKSRMLFDGHGISQTPLACRKGSVTGTWLSLQIFVPRRGTECEKSHSNLSIKGPCKDDGNAFGR